MVICTRERPELLAECLAALRGQGDPLDVVVVDASSSDASAVVCHDQPGLRVTRRTAEPGLARQRNLGVDEARRLGADVVLFVDDDVVVEPNYVAAVLAAFAEHPDVAGVGGVVVDEPPVGLVFVKRIFRLWSNRPGAVLPSGRNVLGHHPHGTFPRRVDWLSTSSASLRLSLVADLRFDERLAGYSYGEDLDLTFRLSRRHPLLVIADARAHHSRSQLNRPAPAALARRKTVLLHAWVSEQRGNGLRRRWFWWSALGEVLINTGAALVGRRAAWGTARGTVTGCVHIWRHGSSRSA